MNISPYFSKRKIDLMKLTNPLLIAIFGALLASGVSFMLPDSDKADKSVVVAPHAKKVKPKGTTTKSHPAAPRSSGKKTATRIPLAGSNVKSGPQPGSPVVAGDLSWLHIQDAANLKNSEEKMYFVDVYTDWCGWCKVMDKKTFSDAAVQKALNDKFHVIKFNAEQKEAIKFDGASYNWVNTGRKGVSSLAQKFLGARLSYPSFVYLDKDLKVIKVTRGFKEPEAFLSELKLITG